MRLTGKDTDIRYAVCIDNEGFEVDLEKLKVYAVLPASREETDLALIRVVDESGEDYLYPADYFALVEMSQTDEKSVRGTMIKRENGER